MNKSSLLQPFTLLTRILHTVRSNSRLWVVILLTLPTMFLRTDAADGPADNHPETVRRIPKEGIEVPAEKEAELRASLQVLQNKLAQAAELKAVQEAGLLPDVMIFERAVRCALDYNEFFAPPEIDRAGELLKEGIRRADELIAGQPSWIHQHGLVVRGYISRLDQTVQPYGLVVPDSYHFGQPAPTRCDLWFHGRGETLSELNFLWDRMRNRGQYTPAHTIVLHPYGRYSNAFKFAGEVDVLEGLESAKHRYRIDEDRISVRGFSMGGAACWQFATHYADRWFAANPGAGFSETPQFLQTFQQETLNPEPWEKALWNLYDCDRYAGNLLQCPTIAYSGEIDRQKQAADVMEAALLDRGMHLRHVIGAGVAHKIDDRSREMIDQAMDQLAQRGRIRQPRRLRFETYTLKYNQMHWLTVNRLHEHWQPALVDVSLQGPAGESGTVTVQLQNVDDFSLTFEAGAFPFNADVAAVQLLIVSGDSDETQDVTAISVDGVQSDGSWNVRLTRSPNTGWAVADDNVDSGLAKRHNLQGPIDDALMDSFVFVRGTGTPANAAAGRWANAELDRAVEHWRRHFRGDARVINDTDVTDKLIQTSNLILWGDPSSNQVLQKIAGDLPVKWDAQSVTVGPRSFPAANHAPVMIYPNPLNPNRYVVLNSSFTFRDYAYLNNARQVPMLPDWAIINLETPAGNVWPGKVVAADFFDESWQLK
ncbi:MAG: prolyl oligopeptidase family serine peptidase [Planctomycetaceae bacterium]|nr:prolyl oligopeptidase family serine peptidase [Planctomycetaceae bacterium]